MKKELLLPVVILVVLAAVVFFYPAPAQGLAQLPEEGNLLVVTLITAAVTWALYQISVVLKIDFSGYAAPIAAVLSPLIITFIEHYLALIPSVFDNLALSIIHLIVLALGSVGTLIITNRVQKRQTRELLA